MCNLTPNQFKLVLENENAESRYQSFVWRRFQNGKSKRNIFVVFCYAALPGKNTVQTYKKLSDVYGEEIFLQTTTVSELVC